MWNTEKMRTVVGGRRAVVFTSLVALVAAGAVYWFDPLRWWTETTEGPHYHWRQARAALAESDFGRAERHLRACLTYWPIDPEVHFNLARTYRRLERFEEFAQHLQAAEVLQWPSTEIQFEMLLLEAQSGNTQKAEASLVPYLRSSDGRDELIYEAIVQGHLKNLRVLDAIRWAEPWINRYPDKWQPYLYRARAYHIGGSGHSAVKDYRRVLALKEDHTAARQGLAGLLVTGGQFAAAAAEFEILLKEDPNNARALAGLAHCQISLGETQVARQTLDRLLKLDKENPAGLLMLAMLELSAGKAGEALEHLRRAEAKAPNEPDILQTFIQAYQQFGDEAHAAKYKQRFEEIRKKGKAVNELMEKVRNDPDNLDMRLQIGSGLFELGQEQEALAWLGSILRAEPAHVATHKILADHYQRKGNTHLAEYHRRLAETAATQPADEKTRDRKDAGRETK